METPLQDWRDVEVNADWGPNYHPFSAEAVVVTVNFERESVSPTRQLCLVELGRFPTLTQLGNRPSFRLYCPPPIIPTLPDYLL